MDAKTSELQIEKLESTTVEIPVSRAKNAERERRKIVRQNSRKSSNQRRRGREVVKAGMASSLAVSMLTGLKILRPMRIHPIAAWAFVGMTIIHMIMYEKPSKK
ncbi:MAG: hypothetical protein HQL70_01705 [Magnetococcales bacterium]|nr:hypothetical protein [Magnetococcales bacterium]